MKKLVFILFLAIFALPVSGQETGVYLTNQDGTKTVQFNIGDVIYLDGICPSAGGVIAKIYIMPDKNWASGDQIYDVSAGVEALQVPSTGEIKHEKIWQAFSNGVYDVVVDTNNNQILEAYEKCLIGETGTGFSIGSPTPPPPTPPAPAPVTLPSPPPPAPAPVATPPPPSQPSSAFSLDDYVEVKNLANVRKSPGGATLGQQSKGQGGTVVGGPAQATVGGTSYWFWNINFDEEPDGWVAENTLQATEKPKVEPVQEVVSEEPEETPAVKVVEESVPEEKPAEKELAQVSDTSNGFNMGSLMGSVIMGLAVLLGLIIGSSIIAKALRRE